MSRESQCHDNINMDTSQHPEWAFLYAAFLYSVCVILSRRCKHLATTNFLSMGPTLSRLVVDGM